MVSGFFRINEAPWVIIMYAPGRKILRPIVKFSFYYAMAGSFCITLVLFLVRFVGGGMVRAIKEISQAAQQVAKGNYGKPLPLKRSDEMGQLINSFNTMVEGLKERDLISNTFGRYVDPEIARELLSRPEAARLGGVKREVVIMISDIRDFTTVAESLSPEETIKLLNQYFSHMIGVIQRHRGIIVDFFGDGILSFFDPFDGPVAAAALQAIRCGLAMQEEMESFNAEMRKATLPELKMGIGLNAGEVVVGNIGSESRAKYGIVGSAVNITQRIQATALGGRVVISESVHRHLYENLRIARSFTASLKGFQEEIKLYEVEGTEDFSP
jgi:class 3 adenylate cyclase